MRTAQEEREQFATVDCEMAAAIRTALYRGDPEGPSYRTDIRPLLAAHREGERAAIVAWLRRASLNLSKRKHGLRSRMFYAWTAIWWPENLLSGHLLAVSRCIERLDHLTAEGV